MLTSKTKILSVDDDRAITSIFRRILERCGRYEVREENFSENALRTAQEFRPAMILLDCNMPVMDGAEVAAQLAADPELCSVPIIFVTGFSDRARRSGRPCLEKPVNEKTLLACIESTFKESHPTSASFGRAG
jgi:CheY-like chemotaxis protein